MTRLVLTVALVLGLATDAYAGPPKASREPLPSREIERGLTLPKGWLEFDLGFSHKIADGAWTADGTPRTFATKRWLYTTERLGIRYGVAPRAELWWEMPFHQATLVHHGGTDAVEDDFKISDWSIGDPRFGYRLRLLGEEYPRSALVFEAEYKGPAGSESPGTYIGGPLNMTRFVFTTGTPDLGLGFAGKLQVGPLAFTGHVQYVRRFSGTVQYLVETENSQFAGRIKPGDLVKADVEVMVQAGPVAISVEPRFQYRDVTRLGTTSAGISPGKNLKEVPESDGAALDVRAEVLFHAHRRLDLALTYEVPVVGQDLQFFPIEDLQPTRGNTLGAQAEVRF